MTKPPRSDEVEALIREIQRYLAILEALRALGPRESGPGPPGT